MLGSVFMGIQTFLLTDLRLVAFYNGEPLCLHGDPAYPLGIHLQGPFRGNNLTPQMKLYNKSMSEVRGAVELLFGNIIHLMYGPEGNSCFPNEVKENVRTRGKTKLTSFPRDHTLIYLLNLNKN